MIKRLLPITVALCSVLAAPYFFHVSNADAELNWETLTSSKRSVLVELFTSQGCSSCPPADALLIDIARQAKEHKAQLVVLSFHVDYWNYLGWDDPYSEPWATARQRRYAQILPGSGVYTPQAVVNGELQFVGSSRRKMNAAIMESTAVGADPLGIVLHAKARDDARILEVVKGSRAPRKDELKSLHLGVAYVDASKNNKVSRGENTGSTLSHTNVVELLDLIPLKNTKTEIRLRRPPSAEKPIVIFLQNKKSMQILGSAQIEQ